MNRPARLPVATPYDPEYDGEDLAVLRRRSGGEIRVSLGQNSKGHPAVRIRVWKCGFDRMTVTPGQCLTLAAIGEFPQLVRLLQQALDKITTPGPCAGPR